MEIPEGKVGWLINLDEFTSSEPDVQAAFYKVIHERKVGQRKLHPNVLIAMTGNYLTDNAVVNPLSSAIWSRIVTLHIEPNLNEWIDDYAITNKFDPMLLGFIINNNILTDFNPSMESDRSFCCPRSWKNLNDLIVKNGGYDKEMLPAYAGTITPSVAVNLDNFYSISGQIVSIQEILKDPENARIESRKNLQWATVAQIISNLNDENAIDLFTYVARMDLSMQILMFRSAMSILPNLVTDSKFTPIIARLGREAF
ncbi:ATPase [Alcaligenes phage vB_Af_QDWS595]|uniref:AAA-ATPase n=1 Tax=Alcaligenes phage vB_Af_QDWS595 TaxID=2877946 RepID=A0AAE8Y377_9CAUD|nr:ATPase [Alcaligenes phage vB_Af_QDWS595]UCR75535.1 AAA-ATPase [Alcaligenes phage vB_Af_QDWS595]